MSWRGTPVLVTGAGGFIGSHLTERLAQEGATVRAFVHYNALGSRGWLEAADPAIDIVAGDLCDRDSVAAAVRDVEVVFHLGALIAIPYSYVAPASYGRTNLEGTLNVLQSCRDARVARLVHTSTSEVYGTAVYVPMDELHPLQAQSPYAASKVAADKMVEAFHLSFGVPAVTVRPFNTFGPRQSTRAVIPTIIRQCLDGNTVRLGSVHPLRDLNYVTNTVDGFLQAALVPAAVGRTINLGSGREVSVGEVAQIIGRLTGRQIQIVTDEQRVRPGKSEVERLLASAELARTLLGWTPEVSLEAGLERTIEWTRRRQHREAGDAYTL